jgi:outer membrane biosynthesis protein TonB
MAFRQFMRSDVLVSAGAHLSVLALLLLSTQVHPFASVATESIAVDLVTPREAQQMPDPTPSPTPSPTLDLTTPIKPDEPASSPAPAPPPAQAAAAASSPEQAAAPNRQEAAAQQAQPQRQAQSPIAPPPASMAPPPAPSPGYTQPEPDLTLKYHVMLGLPADLPPAAVTSADKPGDGIDATASNAADLSSSVITEFRRHLKSCLKLPAQIAPSDNVMIKLRVMMTTDGHLAHDPVLIEASASAKGPFLMQSAMSAITACQPYKMLPADRYGEWKVLDLSFTPRDFTS